jgi:hypothetical protein
MHSDNFRHRRSLSVNLNYWFSNPVFSTMSLEVPILSMVIGEARAEAGTGGDVAGIPTCSRHSLTRSARTLDRVLRLSRP